MMLKAMPTVRNSPLTPPRARYQQNPQSIQLDVESLNKRGIAFVRSNQMRDALQCFKEGLSVLNQIVRNSDSVATTENEPSIMSQPAPAMEVKEDILVSPNGVFVFFNQLMLFSKGASLNACASVMLYNVALVHHRLAVQSNSTSIYRKALHLYQLCQRATSSIGIMQFAVVNNMGHIYSHLFDHGVAQACQEWLISHRATLLPLLDSGAGDFVLLGSQRSCAAAMA